MKSRWLLLLAPFAAFACTNDVLVDDSPPAPTGLTYEVEPSGTPGSPSGLLLTWDDVSDPTIEVWHVYSRAQVGDTWLLRGSTTSSTFHDAGIPHLQYYVTAEDDAGIESAPSGSVTVDERLALSRPSSMTTTSLDGAIALTWSDNPFTESPGGFKIYRVYSASYDLDAGLCGVNWSLEGTSVAPEFIAASLTNGVPRCFAVSAISIEGFESLWSPIRSDTPRPDARNVVLYARQFSDAGSGFRFWRDQDADGFADPSEIGLVESGSRTDLDLSVERDAAGDLYLTPVRAGTGVNGYGTVPVADLTSIDFAPDSTYLTSAIQAVPGFGYVFEMDGGDGFARYGAVRVTHVGQDFLILDWAYQTDPGNPELVMSSGN